MTLTYLISTVTGCVSISAFASLVGIPVGITSSAVGLKICVITAEIKKYKSRSKKKQKKHEKLTLLAKFKLNSIEAFLIDSNVSPDEFVLKNNVLKEFDDRNEEMKKVNDKSKNFMIC